MTLPIPLPCHDSDPQVRQKQHVLSPQLPRPEPALTFKGGAARVRPDLPWKYLAALKKPALRLAGCQVRAVVKDTTDLGDTSFFMDTDGRVNDNSPRAGNTFLSVDDGQWHMITLTTRPDGSNGYEAPSEAATSWLDTPLCAGCPTFKGGTKTHAQQCRILLILLRIARAAPGCTCSLPSPPLTSSSVHTDCSGRGACADPGQLGFALAGLSCGAWLPGSVPQDRSNLASRSSRAHLLVS